MTLLYVGIAIKVETSSKFEKLLIILLAPSLAVVAIPIMTVCYIGMVAIVSVWKCVQPDFNDADEDNFSKAGGLKLLEAVAEANIQAVLGWFTSVFTMIRHPDFTSLNIAFAVTLVLFAQFN